LEQIEQLEQLRMMALGIPMICVKTNYASIGVDTPEDLSAVEQALANLERSAD
ncbi:MAG: 3-deoxy-D-manno-octulosonate cytidylyltransferase, partial [Chlorobi bacterium OLB7]